MTGISLRPMFLWFGYCHLRVTAVTTDTLTGPQVFLH